MYLIGFCKTALFSEEQLLQQKIKSQKYKFDYIFTSQNFWSTLPHVLEHANKFKKVRSLFSSQPHNSISMVDIWHVYYGILCFSQLFSQALCPLKKLQRIFCVKMTVMIDKTKIRWRLKCLRAEPPPITHHPANFSGQKTFEIRDIIFRIVTWPYVDDVY